MPKVVLLLPLPSPFCGRRFWVFGSLVDLLRTKNSLKRLSIQKAIRDFRGAITGRTDKGLFITTGSFTSDAKREAIRDGAPPIDLVDGDRLCELLRDFELGVSTRTVKEVLVHRDWFSRE
jgi:restriction endonuclease Mrr